MGVKSRIPKKKCDFFVHVHIFYVIKNSIYTYSRKFILNLNERSKIVLLIY